MQPPVRVSVVVCTINRAAYLRHCLEALCQQTCADDQFDVIVVDNGSQDDTAALVAAFTQRQSNVACIHESRLGLAIARNTGVRAASAPYIAFTDDDAVPDPTWVERISARFATLPDDVAVIGGEVRAIWESPRPDWLTDTMLRPLSAGLMWGPNARFMREGEWLVEVNCAYRKSSLLAAGGFPERLGRVGDSLLSSEGYVNHVMERAGLRIFYDPQILVGHHIPASRLNQSWFRRRSFWQGISMNLAHQYVEQTAARLGIENLAPLNREWEEVAVPSGAAAWADLFEDESAMPLAQQLIYLEHLGYLLQSQSTVIGR